MSAPRDGLRRVYLAGLNDSEPEHWQSRWKAQDPDGIWVQHRSWTRPDCAEWLDELEDALEGGDGPTLLIAHSLGCYLAAAWAAKQALGARLGLFLVAPPDLDSPALRGAATGFEAGLAGPLKAQGVLVASRNDPFAGFGHSLALAERWGLPAVDAGALGHINLASALGHWTLGRAWLGALEARCSEPEHPDQLRVRSR